MTWLQSPRSKYLTVGLGSALLGFLVAWPVFASGQDKKDARPRPPDRTAARRPEQGPGRADQAAQREGRPPRSGRGQDRPAGRRHGWHARDERREARDGRDGDGQHDGRHGREEGRDDGDGQHDARDERRVRRHGRHERVRRRHGDDGRHGHDGNDGHGVDGRDEGPEDEDDRRPARDSRARPTSTTSGRPTSSSTTPNTSPSPPSSRPSSNAAKQKAVTDKANAQRKIEEAEQQLWELTAADQPDATKIDAKVREVEKLRGDQRMAFIRSVGEAAKVLTDDQRKVLLGHAQPAAAPPHVHPKTP